MYALELNLLFNASPIPPSVVGPCAFCGVTVEIELTLSSDIVVASFRETMSLGYETLQNTQR